jgi:hypothetical protein
MRVSANRGLVGVWSLTVAGAICAIGCGSSGGGGHGGTGGNVGSGGLAGSGNTGGGGGAAGTTGTGGTGGGNSGGNAGTGATAGAGGSVAASCPGAAQTNFKYSAKGDSNPFFTSSVAVRTANQFIVFSGYSGPAPSGVDAGAGPGAGADAASQGPNFIYAQAFDAITGTKAGPAAPLFQANNGDLFYVFDVSIAPTGEIVLLHASNERQSPIDDTLYASFFSPSSAGAPLHLVRTVQIESAPLGNAHAIWSVASQGFVLSWKYQTTEWFLGVKKFNPDGTHAGGDTSVVPSLGGYQNDPSRDEGSTGSSGNLLAVASADPNTGLPILALLDSGGNQVGDFAELSTSLTVDSWITTAGTSTGFVSFFTSGGNTGYETFARASTDGGVIGTPVVDAGDAGIKMLPASGFSFPSTATAAKAISDDTGGAGGVGLVLLDADGANFFYVNADGMQHQVINGLVSSAAGTEVSITNYHGSFGVSLFPSSATDNSTQIVGSACKAN